MTPGMSPEEAFALVISLHRLIRCLRHEAPAAGLQPGQLLVMYTLLERGPLRIGELAGHIHSSQPSATVTVSNLEAAGLVAREPDPADRRAIMVTLTAAGRDRLLSLAHGQADLLHARAADLPAAEQDLLRAIVPVLRKLADPGCVAPSRRHVAHPRSRVPH